MTRLWVALFNLMLMAPCAAQQAGPGPVGQPAGPWRDQIHWVSMRDAAGAPHLLFTRFCRPQREASARAVVINHGSPPHPADRVTMRPVACDREAAQWFLTRGYVVIAPMRRGYGLTGGDWAESNGLCSADDYAQSGRESARDVDAVVGYALSLPYIRRDGVVVVGQSAGGWASDAYNSLPHPRVMAFVSMAGGRGGHQHDVPNLICRPDQLIRAAGIFGASATTPMLWVYAANDSFFAPDVATAMYAAFAQAGGKAELIQPGPYDGDGHRLFFGRGGSVIWGPMIERYLATRGAGP